MKKTFLKHINKMRDLDILLFRQATGWLFTNRVRVYILILLVLFWEVLMKTPYLNIIFANNIDAISATIIPLIIGVLVGFNGKKLFKIAVLLFFPLALLTLVKSASLSEQLGNIIYVLLVIACISLVTFLLKDNDER